MSALSATIANAFFAVQLVSASFPIHSAATMSVAQSKQKKNKKNKKKADENEESRPLPPPPPPALDTAAPIAAEGPKNIKCDCHIETQREFARAGVMKKAGWGIFGASLGVSAVYGLLVNGAYLIPVVGPYIGIANDETVEGGFLGVTLGTIQLVSLPIAIVGTVRRHRLAKRIAANKQKTAKLRSNLQLSGSGLQLRF